MYSIETRVKTANASGYLLQLCKHWAHRMPVTFTSTEAHVPFNAENVCLMGADDDGLDVRIDAANALIADEPPPRDTVELLRFASSRLGDKVIDAVDTRTGFRATAFDHGMVRLNGRVLQMKGYAQRTTNEWPAVGISVPPWISDFSNGLITHGNGNLVRWMHVTPSKQDVQSADRLGLIESMPAGDSEGDPSGRRWDQRVEVMRDAIIYNRNDPSILFYEGGNHGISDAHMAELLALKRKWDPHGGRAMGAREMLGSKAAEYGGEMLYINKSGDKPLWAMEYSRDEAARAYQDDFTPPFHKDAPDYNRNVESMAVEDVRRRAGAA